MTNGHKSKGDRPVKLVEQLQIRPTIENETLVKKLAFIRPSAGYRVKMDLMEIDPVRIDDKDGSKEEDEEGGRSVHKSNCCSCLQLRKWSMIDYSGLV